MDSDEIKSKKMKTAFEKQRAKIDKLMANPDAKVKIPENFARPFKDPNRCADIMYNVMGSSAGAGSGEFHLYRNIRRKEEERMAKWSKHLDNATANEEYHKKREETQKLDQERVNKKRQKRLKKKKSAKIKKMKGPDNGKADRTDSDSPASED